MTTTEADGLPYPENRGQTHYEGCYRKRRHHNCAVRMVDELEKHVRNLLYFVEDIEEGDDATVDAARTALHEPQTGE